MDEPVLQALAAAARAFADTLESALATTVVLEPYTPTPGSALSMWLVLSEVARINDEEGRGVTDAESRAIAKAAGMSPRGMAGYYTQASALLGKNDEGRWITKKGRERLELLEAQVAPDGDLEA